MTKKNIIIIGGGFAGVNALKPLSEFTNTLSDNFELILIDKKENFEFLPMLPDLIGGWLHPEALKVDLQKLANRYKCKFIKDEVTYLEFAQRRVQLLNDNLEYEYLIIASGAETNFFNNSALKNNCFKLDSVADAIRIKGEILEKVTQKKQISIVIVGGGYTGIEIATNIHYLIKKQQSSCNIYILEQKQDILTMVLPWIKEEVKQELKKLNIHLICNDSLKKYDKEEEKVFLNSGEKIHEALCIWAAGVKTASFIDHLDIAKEKTRIKVKKDLTLSQTADQNVFAVGDAGYFADETKENGLRMAVMFSIAQGKIAAHNVINHISNQPLEKYHPRDLGYLIPTAYKKAPGIVMGQNIHGILGYLLHYYMCFHRAAWKNKATVLKDILFKKQL